VRLNASIWLKNPALLIIVVDTLEVPVDTINKVQININNYDPQGNSIQTIETGIRSLSEGLPILMKALDECSKAHPFIAGTY
jgi:hypothetical protein